jgi:5'-nucleotidase / UDP-sugar diphosphatase
MTSCLRVLAALALVLVVGVSQSAGQVTLTVLHTNDTHGHLYPFSYPDLAANGETQGLRIHRDIGGIARRATLVKRIRQELADRHAASWLVDAGDYSDGTAFSIEYHGEADLAAMNAVGYDFGTIGNHELNNPAAQVKKLVAATRYQLVCANVSDRSTGSPLVAPFVIRNVGPVRIGLFGLTTHEGATYPAAKEALDVTDEITAARATVKAMVGQVDIIVLLSHAGTDVDEKIAAEVPEIDVIVGGHSHSRLPSGEFVWKSEDLFVGDVNGTVIVQDHKWGGELGRLDLLFMKDDKGICHVDRYRARLLPVTADVPADPDVAAVVDRFWQPLASRYGEVVGQAAGEFSTRGDDAAEYNLMADAVRSLRCRVRRGEHGRRPCAAAARTDYPRRSRDVGPIQQHGCALRGHRSRDQTSARGPRAGRFRNQVQARRGSAGGGHDRRPAARRREDLPGRHEFVLRRCRTAGVGNA